MENNKKIKSIFLGRKVKKYWEIEKEKYYYDRPKLQECTETLERVKILEKEMDFEFVVDEEIYLDELGKYTKVQKKTKDTNGSIIYNVTYVAEEIEDYDDNLKRECKELVKKYEIEEKEREIEYEKSREERKMREKEQDEKYKKFKEEKNKIEKKNTIIFKIPLDNSNRPIIDSYDTEKIRKKAEMSLPMDCNVIFTPFDVNIYGDKEKITISNDIDMNKR